MSPVILKWTTEWGCMLFHSKQSRIPLLSCTMCLKLYYKMDHKHTNTIIIIVVSIIFKHAVLIRDIVSRVPPSPKNISVYFHRNSRAMPSWIQIKKKDNPIFAVKVTSRISCWSISLQYGLVKIQQILKCFDVSFTETVLYDLSFTSIGHD